MSEGLKRDYQIGEEIGRGRFGRVYHCLSSVTGEAFAVKSIEKRALTDPIDRECLEKEAKLTQIAASASPDNVVQIHAVYEDEDDLHIVLDLCQPSDLFDRISLHGPFPEAAAAAVFVPLMEAIAGCHRWGVAHRDVKPDNVLFDSRGRPRLSDFGSADFFAGGAMSGIVGTPYYVAPEVVAGRDYDEKVDVWSAGVVLYLMLAGFPPFDGDSAVEIFDSVLRANLRFPVRAFRGVSTAAKDLIRRMLCKDVSRRLSAEQVLMHPWVLNAEESVSVADLA
ncbi:Phosphoenolpyruvate carboxylase kinase 2 [Acorus calamus]|uniref:Phosphoenolpyruvate carboxylase kinase 2 n=1 Tax=Acorus calamus TaxID=4465 RepID=A0AAV9C6J4_ACOCL|nr:Phosphoenolpyruvate carboxylase kinase 2 [Acorus calamus]